MKYRVFWDKTMYRPAQDDKEFYIDQEGMVFYDSNDTWFPALFEAEGAIVMFWTGLKDCNDTDIYAGDIFINQDGMPGVVTWKANYASWYIRTVSAYNVEWNSAWLHFRYDFVIQGNIHANPELLEIKNDRT